MSLRLFRRRSSRDSTRSTDQDENLGSRPELSSTNYDSNSPASDSSRTPLPTITELNDEVLCAEIWVEDPGDELGGGWEWQAMPEVHAASFVDGRATFLRFEPDCYGDRGLIVRSRPADLVRDVISVPRASSAWTTMEIWEMGVGKPVGDGRHCA